MTSKLEEKFFKLFGIEKRYKIFEDDYGKYRDREERYPQITSDIFLKLICILNLHGYILTKGNEDELKEEIITNIGWVYEDTRVKAEFKKQIQSLFSGTECEF